MSEKLANDPHDCRCPSTSTVIIDAQNAELGYHHTYVTGFDRQLESVIGLGKMSDFTRVGKFQKEFHCLLASLTKEVSNGLFSVQVVCLPAAILTHSRG